jgi:membrane protein required for colicin V production
MFQLLDFILFGIMLVSGLLALARGFTRELLSLIAWGLAAGAAWYAIKQKALMDIVLPHVDPAKPAIAQIIVGAAAFILVLIIASVIGVKISDRVVDSSAGAFDRTLGFLYGLGRGLVLVAICYLFYGWLLPVEKQEDWVRNAVSMPAIRWVSNTMMSYMPPDIAETLSNSSLIGNGAPQGQLQPQGKGNATQTDQNAGISNSQQQGMSNLAKGAAQPVIGQDNPQ